MDEEPLYRTSSHILSSEFIDIRSSLNLCLELQKNALMTYSQCTASPLRVATAFKRDFLLLRQRQPLFLR